MTSGQTFRWKIPDFGFSSFDFGLGDKFPKSIWLGVDGQNWYAVALGEGRLISLSNADEAAFSRLFRLELSLNRVRQEIGGMEGAPGLRVLRQSIPEEVFFTFLCTPNNNVERIRKMVDVLESYGEPFVDLPTRQRFPDTARIAQIPDEELRARAFGYRGRTIPHAARQLLERGEDWLASLKGAEYRDAHAELCLIDGIGPKLADCICLFGLDHSEAVPVDTHIWQVACRDFFPEWKGKSLTGLRYREIGDLFREKFGRNAGLAHQYLFYENMQRYRASRSPS